MELVELQDMVTLETIKAAMGVDSLTAAETLQVEICRKGIQSQIREHCQTGITQPVSGSFVAYLPDAGSGLSAYGIDSDTISRTPDGIAFNNYASPQYELLLPQLWVRSVSEVKVLWSGRGDPDSFDAVSPLSPSQYTLDFDSSGVSRSGILRRKYSTWPTPERSVKVTYVAGLTTAEFNTHFPGLVAIVCDEVISALTLLQQRADGDGAITSESAGGQSSVGYDSKSVRVNAGISVRAKQAFDDAGFERIL